MSVIKPDQNQPTHRVEKTSEETPQQTDLADFCFKCGGNCIDHMYMCNDCYEHENGIDIRPYSQLNAEQQRLIDLYFG